MPLSTANFKKSFITIRSAYVIIKKRTKLQKKNENNYKMIQKNENQSKKISQNQRMGYCESIRWYRSGFGVVLEWFRER